MRQLGLRVAVGALALVGACLGGGPAWAESGAQQQAVWQAKWRAGIQAVEARRRWVTDESHAQERRSADPRIVGFVKAWWSQGRLAYAEGRSKDSSWALLGDEQGRLLAGVEAKTLGAGAFDESRLLRSGGLWLRRVVRREVGSAAQFEELRPARPTEVQALEQRWASLGRSLGRP